MLQIRMSIRQKLKEMFFMLCALVRSNHKSKILFYHDIYKTINYKAADAEVYMGTPLSLFKQHLDVIQQEGFKVVPSITSREFQVKIMLDDGFRGIYECRDFFYERNLCPTIFLAVDLIGQPGFLTQEEILELQNHGFIFECHSWSHKNLTQFNDEALEKELQLSKEYLSKLLKKSVTEICLPIGYYNGRVISKIKECGYLKVYSSIPGNYYEPIDYEMITRNLVQYASAKELKYILRGGNQFLQKRYKKLHCLD